MISPATSRPAAGEAEALIGDPLAAADAELAGVGPILRHLLSATDPAPFSDRVVAQVHAQIDDLARQLLAGPERRADAEQAATLGEALLANPTLLAHCHALALEAQLAQRLADEIGLDPVAPPLVQGLIASADGDVAASAMALLAAQARFGQAHRRGEMPLEELPAGIRLAALKLAEAWGHRAAFPETRADAAVSRLELLDRIANRMGADALDLARAGLSLFVTALGQSARIDRGTAVLATIEGQLPRLALALLASGLPPEHAEAQLIALHPDGALPAGFAALNAARAAALLAAAG